MIFTEPASAVSQPRPTPASHGQHREHRDEDRHRRRARRPRTPCSRRCHAAAVAQLAHPHPHHERKRKARCGFHGDRDRDQRDTRDGVALRTSARCRPSSSPTISISLCTPPIRWMITSGLSTQIHSAAAPLAPTWRATPRCRPDQHHQPGQHAQPQHHGAGDHVVADEHRDELGDQDERGPVRRGGRRPDRTDVVQQRIRVVDRADQRTGRSRRATVRPAPDTSRCRG